MNKTKLSCEINLGRFLMAMLLMNIICDLQSVTSSQFPVKVKSSSEVRGGPSDLVNAVRNLEDDEALQTSMDEDEGYELPVANFEQEYEEARPEVIMSEHQLRKRYLCKQSFIFNPVSGRCQPSLSALRKGRI